MAVLSRHLAYLLKSLKIIICVPIRLSEVDDNTHFMHLLLKRKINTKMQISKIVKSAIDKHHEN